MPYVYLETLGCSKNQVDSEKILYQLENNGYVITDDPINADVIIVNTCCFIQSAKEEAIETIFELSRYKEAGQCRKLVVTGCLAQYYAEVLKSEIQEIDAILGIGDPTAILEILNTNKEMILPEYNASDPYQRKLTTYPGSAYLKISEGCSNYCSYCIIPKIRGNLHSRKIETILQELNMLIDFNVKEVILIAQDTTNYGMDLYQEKKLGELVKKMDAELNDSYWIRLLYLHPDHIDFKLLEILKQTRHFIPYFDLPFQSGSPRILKLMNRKDQIEDHYRLIQDIRALFPDAVLRSTFITGFPDETDNEFRQTLEFIKNIRFDWIGGFTYSKENDTAAAKFKNQIKEAVKKERLAQIQKLADEITQEQLKRFINTTQNILIEEKVADENLYIGRFWGQAPEVDGLTVVESQNAQIGDFIKTTIIKLNDKDFYAKAAVNKK